MDTNLNNQFAALFACVSPREAENNPPLSRQTAKLKELLKRCQESNEKESINAKRNQETVFTPIGRSQDQNEYHSSNTLPRYPEHSPGLR